MADTGGRALRAVRSAADVTLRELDVRIYPTPTGARWVVFTRISRGPDRWDRTVDSGGLDLGEAAALDSRGAVLRACADALAEAADKIERHS